MTDLKDTAIYRISHTKDIEEINDILIEECEKAIKDKEKEMLDKFEKMIDERISNCEFTIDRINDSNEELDVDEQLDEDISLHQLQGRIAELKDLKQKLNSLSKKEGVE